jgi:hypothetical protein
MTGWLSRRPNNQQSLNIVFEGHTNMSVVLR